MSAENDAMNTLQAAGYAPAPEKSYDLRKEVNGMVNTF